MPLLVYFSKRKLEANEKAKSKEEEFDTPKESLEMKANLSDMPTIQNFVALQKEPKRMLAC